MIIRIVIKIQIHFSVGISDENFTCWNSSDKRSINQYHVCDTYDNCLGGEDEAIETCKVIWTYYKIVLPFFMIEISHH